MIFGEKISTSFSGKHILSVSQFDPRSLEYLFKKTDWVIAQLKRKKDIKILQRSVVALLFFEPSTRTFVSFSSAIKKLGGSTIDLLSPKETTSYAKSESLSDSMKVFSCYTDLVIIRHPDQGYVTEAAKHSEVPVISAGEGSGEHPTQALYDSYTIYQKHNRLSKLKGLILGDALYSRSIHSLLKLLALYPRNTVYLLSPKGLELSMELERNLTKKLKIVRINSSSQIPTDCDFWYTNRVQKERFKSPALYKSALKNFPIITPELLKEKGNTRMIIMDPLPRVGNIDERVDDDPRAIYLTTQLQNGFYVRAALVSLVLGKI